MVNISQIHMDKKIKKEVEKVLSSGFLVQGDKVKQLEEKLAKINHVKYAVVVSSGTAALHTALSAIDIKRGDEVITTPFSFIATVNSILMCGAKPVFVDIDERTYNIDPDLIEAKITKKTKAILTVDLYGQSCDYTKIRKIAKKHNLKLVSDSAQAIGGSFKKKSIAAWVDTACFSFYATKNIAMGEGGAILTNDRKIYEFAKRFRSHGQDMEKPYVYHHLGYNYRATDIMAVIGISQLQFLEKWTKQRCKNAKKLISGLKNIKGIIPPNIPEIGEHVFHQFTIQVTGEFAKSRDELQSFLIKNGVRSSVFYPSILAELPFVKNIAVYKKDLYKVAEKVTRQVLSLPVHPQLKKKDLEKIISLIKRASNEKK